MSYYHYTKFYKNYIKLLIKYEKDQGIIDAVKYYIRGNLDANPLENLNAKVIESRFNITEKQSLIAFKILKNYYQSGAGE